MTIKTIDEHAYEIVTEEGTFAVCKDTLAKFDATKHEHGVVVPERLRTLDHGRPWRDDQFAACRVSSSRDMSR